MSVIAGTPLPGSIPPTHPLTLPFLPPPLPCAPLPHGRHTCTPHVTRRLYGLDAGSRPRSSNPGGVPGEYLDSRLPSQLLEKPFGGGELRDDQQMFESTRLSDRT